MFKQLRLNMWVSSLTRFIPEHIYDLGNQLIDMETLKGRDCYGGLDLSSTGDITAFVLMFPPRTSEEKYIMLPFFWIPEDTIPQRVRRASVPYDVWYQQGYLMATEGNVIHYGFIEKVIEELGKTYHILEIAFDRWGAVQMTQNLEGMGFTVVPFGQGFKDMSPPTKEFYKLLMEGRIIHGGNPVMAWMAGNVVVDTDPAGNIKPTKAKSPEKIDGIVAAIMALDRCIRNEGQQQGSVYDERDMIDFLVFLSLLSFHIKTRKKAGKNRERKGGFYEVSDECRMVEGSRYPCCKDDVPDRRSSDRDPDARWYCGLDGSWQCSYRGRRCIPRYQPCRSAGAGEGG